MKNVIRIFALILCLTFCFGAIGCSVDDMLLGSANKDTGGWGDSYAPSIDSSDDGGDFGGSDGGPLFGGADDGDSFGGADKIYPPSFDEDASEMAPGAGGEGDAEGGFSDTTTDGKDDHDGGEGGYVSKAGIITASEWNDNTYYQYWRDTFSQDGGKFYGVADGWHFYSLNRLAVLVTDPDGSGIAGAHVTLTDENGNEKYHAVSDANGVAYLFSNGTGATVTVSSGEYTSTAAVADAEDGKLSVVLEGHAPKSNVIDLMFVIDVTGSMTDELDYLKEELSDVIKRVAKSNTGAVINLALLFYRDHGDSVPFAYFDFLNCTENTNLDAQISALMNQHASGGGDYPEAVDDALALAVAKQWSTGATTKLIFHLLDAPPHSGNDNKDKYYAAVCEAARLGIRICPIICSGTNTMTEYLVREAAIHTGGTFIYVTDDSGIGNSHHDPNLPNTVVELLNSMLVRLINGYHSGTFEPAVYWKTDINENGGQ